MLKNYNITPDLTKWVSKDGKQEIKCEKVMGMTSMLEKLNLELDGRHHSGIDDARNIAKVAQHLIDLGLTFSHEMVHYR